MFCKFDLNVVQVQYMQDNSFFFFGYHARVQPSQKEAPGGSNRSHDSILGFRDTFFWAAKTLCFLVLLFLYYKLHIVGHQVPVPNHLELPSPKVVCSYTVLHYIDITPMVFHTSRYAIVLAVCLQIAALVTLFQVVDEGKNAQHEDKPTVPGLYLAFVRTNSQPPRP
jgi:hypothetical protein